jgi:uncharacterized iron-regulated membrane protein
VHRQRHLRAWDAVHRWTSLACTLFLFLLCLTGLPLIFGQEIDKLTQPQVHADTPAGAASMASLDRVVATAVALHPAMHPLFASHEPREPRIWYVTLGTVNGAKLTQVAVDARTLSVVGRLAVGRSGLMGVIRSLHVDLFAGLKGKLFLGVMGLLFIASLASGVMLYAPFVRKREFGAVRRNSGPRSRWLDLHNLMGIATLLWASVVGITGVMNTCSDLLLAQWRSGVLSQATLAAAIPEQGLVSSQTALSIALTRMHDRKVAFVAFPGSSFAGQSLYGIYSRGDTPLTARLVRPILVDARNGSIVSDQPLPWYLLLLLLSEPLHFGDYGGMPLKILWAALDLIAIVILGSGVYLFAARMLPARMRPARAAI